MKTNKPFKIDAKTLASLRGETAHERMLHRLHAVALVLFGASAKAVAEAFGDSPRAVAYWVTQYKAKGITGLVGRTSPGRTPRLTESQMKSLASDIQSEKAASNPVNAAWLSMHIKKAFGISYRPRQCWRLLKQLRA